MEDEKSKNNEQMQKINNISIGVSIIVILVFFIIAWIGINSLFSSSDDNGNKEPSEVELMSYTQTVLKDNLNSPKYSSYKEDYNFIKTGLRYKIEGKVNNEKFWMIIEFVDDSYKEYDLISLQVGNKKIR